MFPPNTTENHNSPRTAVDNITHPTGSPTSKITRHSEGVETYRGQPT